MNEYFRISNNLLLTLLCLASMLMSACATKQDTKYLDLTISGSKIQNPDIHGNISPLVINLYELSSIEQFEVLSPYDMRVGVDSRIKDDIISKEKLLLLPNTKIVKKIRLLKPHSKVAIAAEFMSIEDAEWKYIINFDENDSHVTESVIITNNSILKLHDKEAK